MTLAGRNVVGTGAGPGIGRALALASAPSADVANAVLFLVGEEAAYLTGALRELRGDPPESLGVLARTAARLPVLT